MAGSALALMLDNWDSWEHNDTAHALPLAPVQPPATGANLGSDLASTSANTTGTAPRPLNPSRNDSSLENPIMQPATRRRAAARACVTRDPSLPGPSTGHAPPQPKQRTPKRVHSKKARAEGQLTAKEKKKAAKEKRAAKKGKGIPLIPWKRSLIPRGPAGNFDFKRITDFRRQGTFFGRRRKAIIEVDWADGTTSWIYGSWFGGTLAAYNMWISRIMAQAEQLPADFLNESGSLLGHLTPEFFPDQYETESEEDSDSDSDSEDF
jgi:hypothetical protein